MTQPLPQQPDTRKAAELAIELIERELSVESGRRNSETIAYGREILQALTGTKQIPAARRILSELSK